MRSPEPRPDPSHSAQSHGNVRSGMALIDTDGILEGLLLQVKNARAILLHPAQGNREDAFWNSSVVLWEQ